MNKYQLGDIIEICNGTNYSHLIEGNIPLYGSGGLMSYVNDYLYDGEAVLLPRKGTLTNIMYVKEKFWTVDTMYYAKTKETVDAYYLYRYLNLLDLSHLDSGSTLPSMTKSAYNSLEIILPSINTQRAISKILRSLDAKIELNNKINAQLEAMAKLIYDYWFVQFEFPTGEAQAQQLGNLSLVGKPYKSSGGKMVYNPELKREIPEGWTSEQIGNLLAKNERTKKILSSEYLENGEIPIIDQSTKFICGFTNDKEAIISTNKPRIIFGDHTRIVKLINFDFARGADGTQVLLSNNDRMPQHLFYHSLLKIDLSNYGYARHFKFLKDIRIVVPDIEISNTFENMVKPYFEKVRHNIMENQKLASLRDWLLPMLMNGQVRVANALEKGSLSEVESGLGMVAEEGETCY
jgi:type I restriction enzyme S subunit